ncbi:hypothetical protein O1611_g2062 [Lasiodiplodia mahajangana]|uniref:Uncharacterized protein n=1 Tax=Lasiodiplodia mahajangana TaxID=1108764 RepID=A0ACC2JWB1_9PEZI|nr:hypothetical protein O1611_g2062 [Lasiodiplodia mahajangana]
MTGCQYKWEGKLCGEPMESWPLCEEHWVLRKLTHDYYKATEAKFRSFIPTGDPKDDEYLFEERHKFLLLTAAARTVHAELFFSDHPCDGHELYLRDIIYKLHQEEALLHIRKKGFVVEGASYGDMISVAIASFRQACFDWMKSDKQQGLGQFIRGFPRAVASGTTVPEDVLQRMKPPSPDEVEWFRNAKNYRFLAGSKGTNSCKEIAQYRDNIRDNQLWGVCLNMSLFGYIM